MSGDLPARDVIAYRLGELRGEESSYWEYDAAELVDALTAAGWRLERDDQWEWAAMYPDGDLDDGPDEESARYAVSTGQDMKLVRRSVGEWKSEPFDD